ncbi:MULTISPECIES: hypothetical protein [Arthrobacter]|uniref:hypothetical protein n=1 Tax=Arthrobacter TaxID=1663 RepID=UPI0014043F8D|nr:MULTISPECIES: hypothetical protein [Arthrobacter]MBT8162781.1 hypothetical protein [Arthrobacter sp. GN70]
MDPLVILALLCDMRQQSAVLHQQNEELRQLVAHRDREIDQLRLQLLPESAKESLVP